MGACVGARVHASAAAPLAAHAEEIRIHVAGLHATGVSQDALCAWRRGPRFPNVARELKNIVGL